MLFRSGTITFTPAPGYSGPISFSYTLSDGTATTTASVTGTVLPVAAPVPAGNDPVPPAPAEPLAVPVVAETVEPAEPLPALYHLSSATSWFAGTRSPWSSFDVPMQPELDPQLFILPTLERLRQEGGFGTDTDRLGDGFNHLALRFDTSLHILPEARSIAREAEQIREQAERMVPNVFTGTTLDSDLLDPMTAEEAPDGPVDEAAAGEDGATAAPAAGDGNQPADIPAEAMPTRPVARVPFAAQLRQAANERTALLSGRFFL